MDFLKGSGLGLERRTLRRLIKICGFPGVDYPVEDIEIDGVQHAVEYLHENPGKFIFLDNPRGSRKRFGQKNRRIMPFHYGEFTEITNPADDMGWDVVVVPSAFTEEEDAKREHIPSGHNLVPVGYVPVNDSQEEWSEKTRSASRPEGKPAPVGNDKIILAPDGVYTEADQRSIEDFFGSMWNFKKTIWFK